MKKTIKDLIAQMTLQEKIQMLHGNGFFRTEGVERLSIPGLHFSDGPGGVRQEFENEATIPIGQSFDYVSYLASNTSIASTWNRRLAYDSGRILGEEARGRGKDVILAPGVNIKRTPLCGRSFEYMSEDPYLTGELATPLVHGIQTADVAACVKHFAVNNQELDRMSVDVHVSERALQEIYYPAFHKVLFEGNCYSIMGSYNKLRGVHCCENGKLLKDTLRKDWGYKGVTISDWGGTHSTDGCALGGLDIEMSVTPDYDDYYMAQPLKAKVEAGEIPESVLDEKIERILQMMEHIHMFSDERKPGSYNIPEHQQVTERIALESVVLMKNDDAVLPLNRKKIKRLAVIGDNANRAMSLGGGSSEVKALYEITPLLGLSMYLGGNAEVIYAPGYYVDNEKNVVGEVDWQAHSLEVDYTTEHGRELAREILLPQQKKLREDAVALAKTCDAVIFIGGLNHAYDTEGFDKSSYILPYAQDELIQELTAVCPDTIVYLISGSAVSTKSWMDSTKALLWSSLNGMHGGTALAQLIFGDVSPSGKLPESFPFELSDCSAHSIGEYPGKLDTKGQRTVRYDEGIYVGYRHYKSRNLPVAFPFGHGLSYSTFMLSDASLVRDDTSGRITIDATLKNTGKMTAAETVQVYVLPVNHSDRPSIELKGFEKYELAPGECTNVHLTLDARALAYYDEARQDWIEPAGEYSIAIGTSSEDLQLQMSVTVS